MPFVIAPAAGLAMLAALMMSVSACSGGEKIVAPGGNTPSTDTRLSAADSQYMANTLINASFDAMKNLRRMPTSSLPGVFQNVPPCTASTTVGGVDANGNGIPDDKTATYTTTGCAYSSGGANVTVSGSARVQDVGGILGYRVTYNAYTVTATKGDSVTRTVINGSFEYRWVSTTSATSSDNSVLVLDVRSSLGSIVFTRTAAFSGTFTPSAGGSIAANQLFPSGSYAVTGSISVNAVVTGNQVQQGFPSTQTLTMNVNTTASLFVNSGCSSDASFSSGQIAGAVTGSNQGALSVRFTSCGSGTTTGPGVTGPGKR